MNPPISIKELTLREKLSMMEALWDDLAKTPENIPSPSWHGDVLDSRMSSIRDGDSHLQNWEDAKRSLRKDVE